jgi:hypothetical protein
MNGEDVTRRLVTIDGENYYLIVGDTLVQATVPRENDPLIEKTRLIVESVCNAISEVLEIRHDKQVMREMSQTVPGEGKLLSDLPTTCAAEDGQADRSDLRDCQMEETAGMESQESTVV